MDKHALCKRRSRHAQIHLAPLDPEQAIALVTMLEKAVEAVWRAHGDAMADYLGRTAPDSTPRPPDAVWSGRADADADETEGF